MEDLKEKDILDFLSDCYKITEFSEIEEGLYTANCPNHPDQIQSLEISLKKNSCYCRICQFGGSLDQLRGTEKKSKATKKSVKDQDSQTSHQKKYGKGKEEFESGKKSDTHGDEIMPIINERLRRRLSPYIIETVEGKLDEVREQIYSLLAFAPDRAGEIKILDEFLGLNIKALVEDKLKLIGTWIYNKKLLGEKLTLLDKSIVPADDPRIFALLKLIAMGIWEPFKFDSIRSSLILRLKKYASIKTQQEFGEFLGRLIQVKSIPQYAIARIENGTTLIESGAASVFRTSIQMFARKILEENLSFPKDTKNVQSEIGQTIDEL